MSAQRSRVTDPEKIIKETFREAGYADGWTETVLADYDHGLAEKIRQEADRYIPGTMKHRVVRLAADLIDPEVSCASGCTCACHSADPSPCDDCQGVSADARS